MDCIVQLQAGMYLSGTMQCCTQLLLTQAFCMYENNLVLWVCCLSQALGFIMGMQWCFTVPTASFL